MGGPMKKSKKDFQKVKLKVGRQVQKGLNFTDTSFKSKKIVIREQLKEDAKSTKELTSSAFHKINSSNNVTVVEGINAINRILHLLDADQRHTVLKRLGTLCSSPDVQIRMGSSTVINKTLDRFPAEQRQAFSAKLILNLQCALTSLDWNIKKDALELLNILLRHIPEQVSRNYAVMENVMDLVSFTKEDNSGRKLNMELKCNTNHLRLWSQVCTALTKLISSVTKTFFSSGKQRIKACSGLSSNNPPIRWFAHKAPATRVAVQQQGTNVACDFIPVLLEMWAGAESAEIAKNSSQMRYDLLSKISVLMGTIAEWTDCSDDRNFRALPDIVVGFFKSRFPITLDKSSCVDINLRLAKLMITLHNSKNLPLNQSLFLELKKQATVSDIKLTLDVAALAAKDTPGVLEYVNSLFFTKKAQLRRPFYNFYLKVAGSIENDDYLNRMLFKVPAFVSKIIIQYPDLCCDEVAFLEKLHSFMFPSYINGISSLSLSTLENLVRITHKQSQLALRLILDQKILKEEHLKIIIDLWLDDQLSDQDIYFVVGHLIWKMDEAFAAILSDPKNPDFMDIHIELVKLISEFTLQIYLDLDDSLRPRKSGCHALQSTMEYFEQIHKVSLTLNSCSPERRKMYDNLRHILLNDSHLKDQALSLTCRITDVWGFSDELRSFSSTTLTNVISFLDAGDILGGEMLEQYDKLMNQLIISQFLTGERDTNVLKACLKYFDSVGTESFLCDMNAVMDARLDDCDDKLHYAFAKCIKYLQKNQLCVDEGRFQDLVEDVLRLADGSTGESSDSM